MFNAMPSKSNSIIFLGDSITEGCKWNELFNDSNILNRGIGGDTTEGVLNRIDEVIRHTPKKLFIAIGTNDISRGFSTDKIIANYRAIINKVKLASPSTAIYVQSILPVCIKPFSVFSHNNKGILAVNSALEPLCKELGIPYLDVHSKFKDENGKLKSNLTNDGLHLLGDGYLIWKDLIEEYVVG